jgi:hypothetical protein
MMTPKDPTQLEAFRKQVREHAGRMQKGGCSMMQDMSGANASPAGRSHQEMMRGMKKQDPAPKDDSHDVHHAQ